MELQLIRSFIEVAESGSFAAASDRLLVTQSAVSLRIQRLEEQLGRPLFTRSKDGVALTPAGREFRSFAVTILRDWEQARQRVSAVEEARPCLAIGAEPSLWPRFGFGWLDRLGETMPELALRAEMGRPESLSQQILSGNIQVMLSYTAVTRAGLVTLPLLEEQLVMVSSSAGASLDELGGSYALVDWGEEFLRFHAEALPQLHEPRLVMALGSLTAGFILSRPFAAYLPARSVKRYVDRGALHLVADAPIFAHPAWVTWRDDLDQKIRNVAEATLAQAVVRAEDEASGLTDLL